MVIQGGGNAGQKQRTENNHAANPGRVHQPHVGHHMASEPGADGNPNVEGRDVQAGSNIHGMRSVTFSQLDHIHLQAWHIAEGKCTPNQKGDHGCNRVVSAEGQNEQDGREAAKNDVQR